jgi:transketolase
MDTDRLEALARLIRYYILASSTEAGSGHPTSSLSAVELMTALLFGGVLRYDPATPDHPNNDRLIFSKGHASPLVYALWAAAGCISEQDLMTMRRFGSPLEGHPTPRFPYAEAATGSLGQGLSIGVGMALNARYLDKLPYRTFVLLGDSEMAEGSCWEAMQIAAHDGLDNLIGIVDVNGLGQRGETMAGHDTGAYAARVSAFGWDTVEVDGHDLPAVLAAYQRAVRAGRPAMIVARTVKGKGVSFLEDKGGWHGKALSKDQLAQALRELGPPDRSLRGEIAKPEDRRPDKVAPRPAGQTSYDPAKPVATRAAYGLALRRISPAFPDLIVLDGEVSNSTCSEVFQRAYPERSFEMYIAEQNMVGAAVGLARRGKIPFVSTFAAFFTRAFDQIRMSRYSEANIKLCGSHAGVSIGEDGPSQMGLEDLAMFRTLFDAIVLYPADAVSTDRLVEEAAARRGIVYLRTTRSATPILYGPGETFPVGGCKVLRRSGGDRATIVAAGITLHEALAAHEDLAREGVPVRVIDLYSVKPVDEITLAEAARETGLILTVEDHVAEGGLGDAVRSALAAQTVRILSLAVRKVPMSGKPAELLEYEGISKAGIARAVREALGSG